MADSAELFGLIGVLGGAVLGAGATMFSSALQTRTAERIRRRSRAEEEMRRLIDLRKSTREALKYLSDAVEGLESGRPDSRDEFMAGWQVARNAVTDAADTSTIDGFGLPQSPSSEEAMRGLQRSRRWGRPRRRQQSPLQGHPGIVISLDAAGFAVGEALRTQDLGTALVQEDMRRLRELVTRVEEGRSVMLATLLDRMEDLQD
ncbi:hypothetical protein ABH930_006685 [Kitasatospora sp. GAS204A]|uniref:hypothetical protein n=1 Tax=unclassified Kitasatospora TaxID=2633591 RepID=UPI00247588E6|nr:hypothetical protein [Kitasatospora sp. GAS204B]MDH6122339.1 hypothetical protein [Kitasatospora sp. GAS204B]